MYTNDCSDVAFEDSWTFIQGTGPIYVEEVEEKEPEVDVNAIFSDGFDEGFSNGYL